MTQQTNTNNRERTNLLSELMQNLQLAWSLMLDPQVSLALKALVPVLAAIYVIMPIDLIPEVVPILGQLDDVAMVLLLVRLFIALAPKDVVQQHKSGTGGARAAAGAGTGDADDVVDADFRVMND